MINKVIQLGFLGHDNGRKNPNRWRLYYPKGISPCLNSCGGATRTIIDDNMQAKIIQIANLVKNPKRKNPQRGRVYFAKGISPCLLDMSRGANTAIFRDCSLRYVVGRSNAHGKGQGNHTLAFHVNPYFGCVTASRFTNREPLIVEIK